MTTPYNFMLVPFAAGEWNLFTFVRKGTSVTIYLNARKVYTATLVEGVNLGGSKLAFGGFSCTVYTVHNLCWGMPVATTRTFFRGVKSSWLPFVAIRGFYLYPFLFLRKFVIACRPSLFVVAHALFDVRYSVTKQWNDAVTT